MSKGADLEGRNLSKHYGPVTALNDVDFAVYPGEIVALVGDNGAGKSTLVKILAGAVIPDAERSISAESASASTTPTMRANAESRTVYQDLALVPARDTTANMFLGRELVRGGVFRPFCAAQAP